MNLHGISQYLNHLFRCGRSDGIKEKTLTFFINPVMYFLC